MSEKLRQVLVDISIGAPLEEVWQAIRDPERIRAWFGWDAETLEDEIAFIFAAHATEDRANNRLAFGEWEGSADSFVLEADGGSTRLRIARDGGAPIDWTGVYQEVPEGWVTFAHQLKLALERHRGEGRRTVYLSGAAMPGAGEPSAALGLDRRLALGDAYSAMLPTGDHVSGTLWHKTAFQAGYTAEQWGDGLLVVTDMGASDKRPHGGGSVLLTTYGLGETAFQDLQARWKAWWAERYQ